MDLATKIHYDLNKNEENPPKEYHEHNPDSSTKIPLHFLPLIKLKSGHKKQQQ